MWLLSALLANVRHGWTWPKVTDETADNTSISTNYGRYRLHRTIFSIFANVFLAWVHHVAARACFPRRGVGYRRQTVVSLLEHSDKKWISWIYLNGKMHLTTFHQTHSAKSKFDKPSHNVFYHRKKFYSTDPSRVKAWSRFWNDDFSREKQFCAFLLIATILAFGGSCSDMSTSNPSYLHIFGVY